jgi:hypothetical protein
LKQIEYSQIVRNRVEKDAVIIVEMFDEREDFMHKLFGG